MLTHDGRREQILSTLAVQDRVRVDRLAQRFGVSVVTIRNDLNALAAAGLVQRQHGGACASRVVQAEMPLSEKLGLHRQRKHSIAAHAATLVQPDDKLILDAGSTTLQLARRLAKQANSHTVFTNSLPIANELCAVTGIELILSGGMLRQASQSFQGPQAEAGLEGYVFDKLFLGADGCDPEFGLSTHDEAEARLNARMCNHARRVIVLADGSKFGRICLHRICGLTRIDTVVSDPSLPPAMQDALTQRGIRVLIAGNE
jgi:DeoR/GlpR family transcriptional regulator of sugar metabolism